MPGPCPRLDQGPGVRAASGAVLTLPGLQQSILRRQPGASPGEGGGFQVGVGGLSPNLNFAVSGVCPLAPTIQPGRPVQTLPTCPSAVLNATPSVGLIWDLATSRPPHWELWLSAWTSVRLSPLLSASQKQASVLSPSGSATCTAWPSPGASATPSPPAGIRRVGTHDFVPCLCAFVLLFHAPYCSLPKHCPLSSDALSLPWAPPLNPWSILCIFQSLQLSYFGGRRSVYAIIHLLSTYYEPDTVLGAENTTVNRSVSGGRVTGGEQHK